MRNRSVPADTVLPHIVFEDVAAAMAWLSRVLGFTEHYRYGEPGIVQGAQMGLGRLVVMLRSARGSEKSPAQSGYRSASLTIFVDDVDTCYARVRDTGAHLVEELHETMYGERQFAFEDLERHHWLISQHVRDVDPAEWGTVVPPTKA